MTKPINPARLSLLADLGHRDEIETERTQDSWIVRVSGATYRFYDDRRTVGLELLTAPDTMRSGWGRWKFGKLLALWYLAGYRWIVIPEAVGNVRQPVWTGYYVWPRFGFDAEMTWDQHARLPRSYQGSRDVQTLLALPGGRDVWRRFGGKLKNLTFDMRLRSRNRKLFGV